MTYTRSNQVEPATRTVRLGPGLARILLASACLALSAPLPVPAASNNPAALSRAPTSYVVQAAHFDIAVGAVKNAGGTITQELRIINAVVAQLSRAQLEALQIDRRLNLMPNGSDTMT